MEMQDHVVARFDLLADRHVDVVPHLRPAAECREHGVRAHDRDRLLDLLPLDLGVEELRQRLDVLLRQGLEGLEHHPQALAGHQALVQSTW